MLSSETEPGAGARSHLHRTDNSQLGHVSSYVSRPVQRNSRGLLAPDKRVDDRIKRQALKDASTNGLK